MSRRTEARAKPARASVALAQVVDETRRLFHRLKQAAERLHSPNELTAGERAVLMELAEHGPRTVPAMASARPVSRQHIQALVDRLLRRDLVERRPNPRHRRSTLIGLTPSGEALTRTVRAREARLLEQLGTRLDPASLEEAVAVLRQVRELLDDLDLPSSARRHGGDDEHSI